MHKRLQIKNIFKILDFKPSSVHIDTLVSIFTPKTYLCVCFKAANSNEFGFVPTVIFPRRAEFVILQLRDFFFSFLTLSGSQLMALFK